MLFRNKILSNHLLLFDYITKKMILSQNVSEEGRNYDLMFCGFFPPYSVLQYFYNTRNTQYTTLYGVPFGQS